MVVPASLIFRDSTLTLSSEIRLCAILNVLVNILIGFRGHAKASPGFGAKVVKLYSSLYLHYNERVTLKLHQTLNPIGRIENLILFRFKSIPSLKFLFLAATCEAVQEHHLHS